MIHILALSGSLRESSLNSLLLRAACQLAPQNIEIALYTKLGELPLFNPDIEGSEYDQPAPAAISAFRAALQSADGVLIASPEYAHGVTGVIKNALDWVVGSGEFVDKPVALINVSSRATIAYAALKETISVMDACIIEEASLTIPLIENQLDEAGVITHPDISIVIRTAINSFAEAINAHAVNTAQN